MTPFTYIEALFKRILTVSNTIKGNFFVLPGHGQEVNTDNLEQVLQDLIEQPKITYPIAAMMPPTIIPKYSKQAEKYKIELLFLTTTYYDGINQIKTPNKNTNTSNHRIIEDWDDMLRPAQDFHKVLSDLIAANQPTIKMGLDTTKEPFIDPISIAGNKKLSGVKLVFHVILFNNCDITDYTAENIAAIAIPSENVHTHPPSPLSKLCKPVRILNQANAVIDEVDSGEDYHVLEFSGIDGGNSSTVYSNSIVAIP